MKYDILKNRSTTIVTKSFPCYVLGNPSTKTILISIHGCFEIIFFGKLTDILKEEYTKIIRGIPQIYNVHENIKQQMATGSHKAEHLDLTRKSIRKYINLPLLILDDIWK
jgi:hypothetical protein